MKKIRMIALAAFAAISMSASAQEPFGTFYLQYNPTYLKYDHHGQTESFYYNTVAVGYNYATPLFRIPLYLEFGGDVQWTFKQKTGESQNMIAAKIPVNLLYSIEISDAFKIQPYAGAYGRFNILGKDKFDGDKSYDWFSDYDNKRFQVGLHGGVKFVISDFAIGGGYYYDLMEIKDNWHFEGFEITVGMVL